MGFRFRRSVKVFPGVRLNFSRSGISTSIGIRGASMTFSGRGTYLNVGVPGTGLSYRERIGDAPPRSVTCSDLPNLVSPPVPTEDPAPPAILDLPGEIKSASNDVLTSANLRDLRDLLADAYAESQRLIAERPMATAELKRTEHRATKWQNGLILRHLFKKKFQSIVAEYEAVKDESEELDREIEKCRIALELNLDSGIETTYESLVDRFRKLAACERIWDTTSSVSVDQARERSSASNAITRTPVNLDLSPATVLAPSRSVTQLSHPPRRCNILKSL